MLTLFGKKKKEDENKSAPPPPGFAPQQSASIIPEANPSNPDESPFAKIFQSISQEYQNTTPPTRPERVGAPPLSVTPDWVQPRELPRSTRMVITPSGAKNAKPPEREAWEENDEGEHGATGEQSEPRASPGPRQVSSQVFDDSAKQSIVAEAQEGSTGPSPPSPPLGRLSSPPFGQVERPDVSVEPGKNRLKDVDKKDEPGEGRIPTFTEGVSSFDSSGEFSLAGFDGLSKLLAETDTVLAQGREKEKELSVKPTIERKDKEFKVPAEQGPKPATIEKQAQNKRPDGKSFEHIFELAKGSLNAPGVAVIDGASGSGKTTLCFGLVDRYLDQGTATIFVSYSQSPADVRDGLKKLGCDIAKYEANYRFMMIDAFTAQSEGFSMELYSLVDPWDVSRLQETIVGNLAVFMGENVRVILDSLDALVAKNDAKEFVKQFGTLVARLREANATLVASVDLSKTGKEVKSWAEDETDCLLEIEVSKGKDGQEHSLTLDHLKGDKFKGTTEAWEIEPGKGPVFV